MAKDRWEAARAKYFSKWLPIAVPVKVYELRTGKVVVKRTIQISGTSCLWSIHTSANSTSEYMTESKSDVRFAFKPLVVR